MSRASDKHENPTGWAAAIESALPGIEACCVSRVVVYARTASTQDAAWRHRPSDTEPGVLALAAVQTGGRGRLGRRWEDGPGRTLPASFALRTGLSDTGLAARAGLGALDACRLAAPHAELGIKWPNDIVTRSGGERKLAGVLVERRGGVAVVGVGVNMSQSGDELAAAGLGRACSLSMLGGDVNRLALAIGLIASMSRWLAADDAAVRSHWGAHDAMAGTRRAFVVNGERVVGEVVGVDPMGVIRVRTERGVRALPVETTRTADGGNEPGGR